MKIVNGDKVTETSAVEMMKNGIPSVENGDAMLFSLAINSKTLMNDQVESFTLVNGEEYMTDDQLEEVKQLLAQAAGIIIESLQVASLENAKKMAENMVKKVKN